MASSRLLFASLLLLSLVAHVADSHKLVEETVKGSLMTESTTTVTGINCKGLCEVRCSKSSRPNLCHRACGTCCFRCNCVPPGTYGNYGSCPCYASLTTRGGARKCP